MNRAKRLLAVLMDHQRVVGSDEYLFVRGTLPSDRFDALCEKWGVPDANKSMQGYAGEDPYEGPAWGVFP